MNRITLKQFLAQDFKTMVNGEITIDLLIDGYGHVNKELIELTPEIEKIYQDYYIFEILVGNGHLRIELDEEKRGK